VINYKIIQKPAFDVVGKVKKFPSAEGKGPAQFWADFSSSKESAVLQAFSRGFAGPFTGGYMLGVAHDVFKEDFKYAIAVEKTSEAVPEGFEVIHIAESAWAIFEVIGHMPHAIFQVALRIYTEWLPSTGYKSTGRMELEVYFNRANYCQIWVPLVMKKDHSGISVVKLSAAPCLFQGAVHGNWIAGSSSEPVSGSFKLTIDADSSVLGSFKGDFTGIIEGRVDNEGQLVATATTANVDIAQMVLKVTGQLTISGNALNITGLFESDKLRRYFSGTGNVFSMEYRFPKRGKKKI
jgi:AraC family transcriptional regulator